MAQVEGVPIEPGWSNAAKLATLGGLRLKGHDLSVGSDLLGLSPRVRRAAPSLQMQSVEPVVASYGATKTATLTVLWNSRSIASLGSSLIFGLFLMFLARLA